MKKCFSDRLMELRKEDRKTQAEMAKIFNVKRSTYGAYEQGINVPAYDKIVLFAQYFNVTVDYLLGNTDNKKHEAEVQQPEVHDVNQALSNLLDELKDKSKPLKIDGYELDDQSRELLIASIENSFQMGKLISAQKKKG